MERTYSNLTIMTKRFIFTLLLATIAIVVKSDNPAPCLQNSSAEISPPTLWRSSTTANDTTIQGKLATQKSNPKIEKSPAVTHAKENSSTFSKADNDTIQQNDKLSGQSRLGSIDLLIKWIYLLVKMT